jgi:FMN phosphatase YigB (HAD superfamily)
MPAANSTTREKASFKGKVLSARCILFDLDGTLYDSPEYSVRLEAEIVRFVSEQLRLGESETKALLDRRRKELGTLTRTIQSLGIDRNAFFDTMADRIDPSLYILGDPTVRSVIGTLKERGFKTGLVSNSGRPLVRKILGAVGLEESLFDVTVTSTEAEPKPSPQPFLLAVKKVDCDVDDVVYMGDREEAEICPAKRFGLKTILFDRNGAAQSTCADAVVRNLSDVLEVVKLARGDHQWRAR